MRAQRLVTDSPRDDCRGRSQFCSRVHYLPPPTHAPTHLPTNLPLSQGSRGTELDKDFTKLETERRAKTKTAPKQANRNPMSVQVRSKRKREIDR